jgi:protein SCO1
VPVLVCLVLGALGGVGTALVTEPAEGPELVRFTVPRQSPPDFRLRDETGAWRSPASARGDVLVVTFIYTSCRDLCPRQAAEIKQAVLGAGGGV